MFKEVEAKLHDPEELLKDLLDEIAQQPVTTKAQLLALEQNTAGTENSTSVSFLDTHRRTSSSPLAAHPIKS